MQKSHVFVGSMALACLLVSAGCNSRADEEPAAPATTTTEAPATAAADTAAPAADVEFASLTGDPAAVAQMARAYRVYWKKVPLEGGDYTLDHTAAVYLMDGQGRFVELISYDAGQDDRVRKLRDLVDRS